MIAARWKSRSHLTVSLHGNKRLIGLPRQTIRSSGRLMTLWSWPVVPPQMVIRSWRPRWRYIICCEWAKLHDDSVSLSLFYFTRDEQIPFWFDQLECQLPHFPWFFLKRKMISLNNIKCQIFTFSYMISCLEFISVDERKKRMRAIYFFSTSECVMTSVIQSAENCWQILDVACHRCIISCKAVTA